MVEQNNSYTIEVNSTSASNAWKQLKVNQGVLVGVYVTQKEEVASLSSYITIHEGIAPTTNTLRTNATPAIKIWSKDICFAVINRRMNGIWIRLRGGKASVTVVYR